MLASFDCFSMLLLLREMGWPRIEVEALVEAADVFDATYILLKVDSLTLETSFL